MFNKFKTSHNTTKSNQINSLILKQETNIIIYLFYISLHNNWFLVQKDYLKLK